MRSWQPFAGVDRLVTYERDAEGNESTLCHACGPATDPEYIPVPCNDCGELFCPLCGDGCDCPKDVD